MSTRELYVTPPEQAGWPVPMAGDSRFTWEYDDGRDRLLALYQKGKDKQWDAVRRIEWDLEVDAGDVLGIPDESMAIYGTKYWDQLGPANIRELRLHLASWQFSQFLHGEQGAMITAARIVESVPDLDSKFYAATQTMDEARHAELYARFLHEKIGLVYPINAQLQALLDDTLTDSRWDMPYLGMQVLIEGSAYQRALRSLLFSRLVPCVRDIGLWSERLQQAYADMGVLDSAKADLDALMRTDEEIAEKLDEERFAAEEAARADEVAQVIAEGA